VRLFHPWVVSHGSSKSKQQAVFRAACCVFGARCNIVRDVVLDALLSRPCAWLHLVTDCHTPTFSAPKLTQAWSTQAWQFSVSGHPSVQSAFWLILCPSRLSRLSNCHHPARQVVLGQARHQTAQRHCLRSLMACPSRLSRLPKCPSSCPTSFTRVGASSSSPVRLPSTRQADIQQDEHNPGGETSSGHYRDDTSVTRESQFGLAVQRGAVIA